MVKNLVSAVILIASLGVGALAQYATVSKWYEIYPEQGKITFYVLMDGTGTYPEYNETCFQLLTDPGGRQWYSSGNGTNYAFCQQDAFYEYYQEDGLFEVQITAYAVPFQGTPPFLPHYYENGTKIQTTIQAWLKLEPPGWIPTSVAVNGLANLGARIITSRSCSGIVSLDAAYAFPPGLQYVASPVQHLEGVGVSALAINYLSFGTLTLKSDNSVAGTATASIQLVSHPCSLQKDPMFTSELTITSAR